MMAGRALIVDRASDDRGSPPYRRCQNPWLRIDDPRTVGRVLLGANVRPSTNARPVSGKTLGDVDAANPLRCAGRVGDGKEADPAVRAVRCERSWSRGQSRESQPATDSRFAGLPIEADDLDQRIGRRIRQRPKQHGADHAEHGGVRAQPKRQRQIAIR